MRKFLFAMLFVGLAANPLFAQNELIGYGERHNQINRRAMQILSGWSLANMAAAGIQYRASDGRDRYFHEMTLMWNAVNLGIAGLGYWRARHSLHNLSLADAIDKQRGIEKLLLLNTGLDAAYIMTGVYLVNRGNDITREGERLQGYGAAIILQGSFLLAFDVVYYFFHTRNNRKLNAILQRVEISNNSVGVRFSF